MSYFWIGGINKHKMILVFGIISVTYLTLSFNSINSMLAVSASHYSQWVRRKSKLRFTELSISTPIQIVFVIKVCLKVFIQKLFISTSPFHRWTKLSLSLCLNVHRNVLGSIEYEFSNISPKPCVYSSVLTLYAQIRLPAIQPFSEKAYTVCNTQFPVWINLNQYLISLVNLHMCKGRRPCSPYTQALLVLNFTFKILLQNLRWSLSNCLDFVYPQTSLDTTKASNNWHIVLGDKSSSVYSA